MDQKLSHTEPCSPVAGLKANTLLALVELVSAHKKQL